jgi:hypothetical protein
VNKYIFSEFKKAGLDNFGKEVLSQLKQLESEFQIVEIV